MESKPVSGVPMEEDGTPIADHKNGSDGEQPTEKPNNPESKKDKKDGGKKTYNSVRRPNVICMTGVETQYVEKDMIKFFRKYMEVDNKVVPL